jgi:Protein of unknown function (DUF3142)
MLRLSTKSFALDALGVVLTIAALTFGAHGFKRASTNSPVAHSPKLFLWAWERPADLRFIDTGKVGVAYLARSINLAADDVVIRPRIQPLLIPDQTKVIAVARIETDRERTPALSSSQRDRAVKAIVQLSALPNVSDIQIDFDATQSERQFYRELLTGLRRELPSGIRLSITALASWCMSDNWISDLPVDAAVPMLFRMTADGKQIVTRLNAGDDFFEPLCRQSYGVSLDEPQPKLLADRSLYVFNPDAWTEKAVQQLLESPK